MHPSLTSSVGIIAMAAGAVAIVALIWGVWATVGMARLRASQRLVLGDHSQDLVAHAARLEREFRTLHSHVDDSITRLDSRVAHAEARLNGAVAHRAVVRYDAYGEMSGRQSTSIALLDADRSGIVLSSIHHRDQARLYVKQIHAGRPELELSPEEAEAVRLAMAGERQAVPEDEVAALRVSGRRGGRRRDEA